MRTLKELFEQTEPGLSPLLDSIRGQVSSTETDQDDFAEEAVGAVGVAGATKKIASKAKASVSSKSKKSTKTKEAKKPASVAKLESKKAPVAAPKKSTYAKGLDPVGYQEWEDAPVKKVKELLSQEPVTKASVPSAEPIPSAIEPATPVVEPKTPNVNTAPTQAVVDDAVTAAQKTLPPSSIGQQVAEVVESKPSLPPSKTFGEPIYGDAPPSAGKALSAANDVALKTPLLQRVMSAASSPIGRKVLGGMGVLGTIYGLYGDEGVGAEPNDPYLNPPKKVDYIPPSSEKTDLNPLMASSKYDTAGSIVADAMRSPEPASPVMTKASALGPASRAISAGEPSASFVKKEQRKTELAPAVGQDVAAQIAQEESFLERFKAAREEEQEKLRSTNLQEAIDRIFSARAGIKPQTERYEKMRQQAYKDVEKKETAEEEAQLRDPNSLVSRQWRQAAESAGITLKGNESAQILKQTMPFLQKHVEGEENREARLQEFNLRMADINLRRDALKKEKLTSDQNSYLERQAKGFAKDKVHEALFILKDAKRAVENYLKNPTPTASASLAYVFAKINDTNSVVRESELKLFGKAGSLYGKFKEQLSDLATGKITERKARELGDFISGKIQSAETDLKTKLEPAIEGGKRRGLDIEDTITAIAGPEYYRQLFLNQATTLPEKTNQAQEKNPKVEAFAKQHNTDYGKALKFLTDTGQL